MNWYYAEDGKQTGPVTEEQLDEMVRDGKLPSSALVWREGLANWQPYAQAKAAGAGAPPTISSPAAPESKAASWYYDDRGKPTGPIGDAELESLVTSGKVRGDTRVWREGMANWIPYAQAKGMAGITPGASPGSAPTTPTTGVGEVVCAECNRVFPRDSVIQYGSVSVCANCKPAFVQKLREGAALPGSDMRYAGFWIRFGAVFIDGMILWVVNIAISLAAGVGFMSAVGVNPNAQFGPLQILLMLLQIAIGISYETFFLGKYGATPGKMACGVRVIVSDGTPISYGRACGRYFAKMLSYMTCTIGFIIAAFDREKRALHDHICNTRVVYK
jgi:uncharacterized RDD family membrane protein YckC